MFYCRNETDLWQVIIWSTMCCRFLQKCAKFLWATWSKFGKLTVFGSERDCIRDLVLLSVWSQEFKPQMALWHMKTNMRFSTQIEFCDILFQKQNYALIAQLPSKFNTALSTIVLICRDFMFPEWKLWIWPLSDMTTSSPGSLCDNRNVAHSHTRWFLKKWLVSLLF